MSCSVITFINNSLYFLVDHSRHALSVASCCVRQITSDEHLIVVIIIVNKSDCLWHTELRNHGFGQARCLLDILRCTGCNIIKYFFFGYTSAKCYRNILKHLSFCIKHLILFRKRHRISARTSRRDDWNTVYRSHIRKHMEQDRMPCFVECCDSLLFFGNNAALLLRTDSDFDKCLFYVFLF